MKAIRFRLGDWWFIAPIDEMQEIVQKYTIYSLPLTKSWMLGVINLRSNVLPVTDLWQFVLQKPHIRDQSKENILIFNDGEWQFGILVSEVKGMIDVNVGQIERKPKIPSVLAKIAHCIKGKKTTNNKTYYVFHPLPLLKMPEFMNSVELNT